MVSRTNAHHLPEAFRKIVDFVLQAPSPPSRLGLARLFSGATVTRLIDEGHLVEAVAAGKACVMVTPLTVKELKHLAPWTADEDRFLKTLWSTGRPIQEIATLLERAGGEVVSRAWQLGADRNQTHGDFLPSVMAWRVRRLRLLIVEAERRGLDRLDEGNGLPHRALLRRFLRARMLVSSPVEGYPARWRSNELSALRGLRDAERTIVVIARSLGRSPQEVAHRLVLEGRFIAGGWSEAEDSVIVESVEQGLSPSKIAQGLHGRSGKSVELRISRLFKNRGKGRPWTAAEWQLMIDAFIAGHRLNAIRVRVPSRNGAAVQRQLYGLLNEQRDTRPWSEADLNIMHKAIHRRETIDDIAKWLSRDVETIREVAQRVWLSGRVRQKKIRNDQLPGLLKKLQQPGTTAIAIAKEFGISKSTLYDAIKRAKGHGGSDD